MAKNNSKTNYDAKYALTKKVMAFYADWTSFDFVQHILKLERTIEELKAKIRQQEITILQPHHHNQLQPEVITNKMYKKSWTNATKVHFILLREQSPLTTEDINKFLLKIDSNFKNYTDSRHFITNILNQMVKVKRLVKVKLPGVITGFYLLPDWMDEQGNPKEAYRPVVDFFK